jgi:ketosteroid isomerase-like protein
MKLSVAVALATLATVVLGCATPPAALTDAERVEIAAAVAASVDSYREAALRLDFEGMMALWADVDGFVLASDGELIDYPTLEQQAREEVTTMQSVISFELSDRHTYVLARDTASHTARFRWAAVLTAGDTLRVRGSWTYVLKNFDGAWRVVQSGGTHVPEDAGSGG